MYSLRGKFKIPLSSTMRPQHLISKFKNNHSLQEVCVVENFPINTAKNLNFCAGFKPTNISIIIDKKENSKNSNSSPLRSYENPESKSPLSRNQNLLNSLHIPMTSGGKRIHELEVGFFV
jgi:hypothetical protein